jgi:hypothetical protein
MSKAVELVLYANNSFRGAVRSLEILGAEAAQRLPSLWSIRNWVLRLGLYELRRPKIFSGDWALILDHTIQIGPHKALLILGVDLQELAQSDFNLRHQNVVALGLEVCERSNGAKVLESLERVQAQVGTPRLLISDAGSDIKKAVGIFCQRNEPTDWIPDVSHRMARLLEMELKGSPRFEQFLTQAALCRSQSQQTGLAALMPPAQRGKARWMNFKPLIAWGLKMIENSTPGWARPKEFKRLFGWLRRFEDDLSEYWLMIHMGEETCRILKQGGLGLEQIRQCRQVLEEFGQSSRRLRRHAAGIGKYLDEMESKVRPGERLLASSDIIESLFGKYKLLTERSPQKAMTSLVLAIGGIVSSRKPDVVREAMETVTMTAVEEWFSENVGQSLRSLRKKAFT